MLLEILEKEKVHLLSAWAPGADSSGTAKETRF